MSLKLNGRTFNSLPLRFRGGAGFEYAETNKASQRNIYAGEGVTDKASGTPSGHLYPSAWIWPQKSGAITSFRGTDGSSIVSATLAGGLNLETTIAGLSEATANMIAVAFGDVTASGSATADATWSALAIMEGSTSGSSTVAGDAIILAVLFAGGASSGSSIATASIGAMVMVEAASSGLASVTATPSALAFMAGTVTPFTELSPQSLAQAVWAATTSGNNTSGTMGKELISKLKKTDFLALKD